MAWCHACEEKKRVEKTISGQFVFKNKETFKKFVERQRRQKGNGFSFRIGKKK